jgi:hypothetical protein
MPKASWNSGRILNPNSQGLPIISQDAAQEKATANQQKNRTHARESVGAAKFEWSEGNSLKNHHQSLLLK